MAKKRNLASTIKAINNLSSISPTSITILMGIILGLIIFCVGSFFISSFVVWLRDSLGLSKELASNISFLATTTLFLLVFIGTPIIYILIHNYQVNKKLKSLHIANIDSMTGIEFEQYLKGLLTFRGYSVSLTKASGDLGVDLIASKNKVKFAIQAKRYKTKVSRRAISDAVAGMNYYKCNQAMVVTNSYFTPDAIKLAQSTNCTLIDRDILAKWVTEFQNNTMH